MKIALSTKSLMIIFSAVFLFLTISTTVVAKSSYAISLNENQILYLFSTSAQVIAAIFGLTLTGFIFFRTELSREESDDETLFETVEILKARYFRLLLFITFMVGLTLLLANLAIACEGKGNTFLVTLVLNAGQSSFATSLLAIAYFIFDVISPKRIAIASQEVKTRIDPPVSKQEVGSIKDFLRNYNGIENLLLQASDDSMQSVVTPNYKPFRRRPSLIRLAESLYHNERISSELFDRLRKLITLRNSIVHGAEPDVSKDAVSESKDILDRLAKAVEQTGGAP
ncbi:MAG: hypothetical protein U0929_18690 [Planctomycetaceae bacterium]